MKKLQALTLIVLLTISSFTFGQTTKSFTIKGKVKKEIMIGAADLQKLTTQIIGTVNITNHKGDLKGTANDMKGILLRDILQQVVIDEENPKLLSEYYFVCVGSDGYKVVYSWNELFNTAVSEKVFIVTQKDGKNLIDDEDNILMISSGDVRTGRRYLKNLESIQVRRVE